MLFPTVDFAVFFATVLGLSWLVPQFSRPWKLLILAASYVFYGWWDWHFVGLIIGSTLLNQGAALAVTRSSGRRRRALVAAAITADLLLLGWFKYAGFLAASVDNTLASLGVHGGLPIAQAVLPVGISFFTFQAIAYVVDVHRGTSQPASLLDFAVYLAFFPHVVAGPIVRAAELIPQFRRRGYARRLDTGRAATLIVGGLLKKVVLASFLAGAIVDPVFGTPRAHSSAEILVAAYAYAVQIWADFSGYTDIAIGCALLLGVRFPDNFDSPYRAHSLQDFWRRWHMTLSRWLRDYVYIPLGGSRGSRLFTMRNLMLTMLLGGLWHGAAWTFVAWGAVHGTGLCVERLWRARRGTPRPTSPWRLALARLATFHVVCLAWLLFRADSLGTAGELLRRLATAHGAAPAVTPTVLLAIAAGIGVQYLPRDLLPRLAARLSAVGPVLQGAGVGAALLVVAALGPQGTAPFIYFRF